MRFKSKKKALQAITWWKREWGYQIRVVTEKFPRQAMGMWQRHCDLSQRLPAGQI